MIYLNGIKITTAEQLEEVMSHLSEYEKTCLRNDFHGIPNAKSDTPQVVSPRQMRIALVMSGISLESVEAMIASLPEPNKTITRVTWEYSVEFQRNNPLLTAMAASLGLTVKQVDDLFLLASSL